MTLARLGALLLLGQRAVSPHGWLQVGSALGLFPLPASGSAWSCWGISCSSPLPWEQHVRKRGRVYSSTLRSALFSHSEQEQTIPGAALQSGRGCALHRAKDGAVLCKAAGCPSFGPSGQRACGRKCHRAPGGVCRDPAGCALGWKGFWVLSWAQQQCMWLLWALSEALWLHAAVLSTAQPIQKGFGLQWLVLSRAPSLPCSRDGASLAFVTSHKAPEAL